MPRRPGTEPVCEVGPGRRATRPRPGREAAELPTSGGYSVCVCVVMLSPCQTGRDGRSDPPCRTRGAASTDCARTVARSSAPRVPVLLPNGGCKRPVAPPVYPMRRGPPSSALRVPVVSSSRQVPASAFIVIAATIRPRRRVGVPRRPPTSCPPALGALPTTCQLPGRAGRCAIRTAERVARRTQ
jgi:hypothetical protein